MRIFLLAFAFLGGCALVQPTPKQTPLRPGEIASASAATGALVVGYSTKDDVRAALGEGSVVDFASGYEVWVYRERKPEQPAPGAELVLLFDPSGVLSKLRVN